MINLLWFLIGALTSLILVIFIGITDVYIWKCPKFKSESKIKIYILATAWELFFLTGGIISGLLIAIKFL